MIGLISLPYTSYMLGRLYGRFNDGLVRLGHVLYVWSNVSIDRADMQLVVKEASDISQFC